MDTNKKIRVLVCEDNSLMLHGLRFILQRFEDLELVGYVRTGTLAVERAQELEPDVILMDLGLPELDGIAATKIIKAKSEAIKVLVVSAEQDPETLKRATEAGADGFLPKPVMDPDALYYEILKTLDSNELKAR